MSEKPHPSDSQQQPLKAQPSHRSREVSWQPRPGLRNRHVQSILASVKLREPVVRRRAKAVLESAAEQVFDCRDGTRLHGLLSRHDPYNPRPLVVLIHGWEGCADSLYLLSVAGVLFQHGFDIFRLHLRDHGPTHHLNPDLFHACLLEEVCEALQQLQAQITPSDWYLVGYSLGGNFALRCATRADDYDLTPRHVVGVSPLLHAGNTLWALENGLPVYRHYFRRKWRRSIRRKAAVFPEQVDADSFCSQDSLTAMSHYFVTHHTPFSQTREYFDSYALTGPVLQHLTVPSTLILSEDDPVIPWQSLEQIQGNQHLEVVRSPYGGHCGFIENFRLDTWIDTFILELLQTSQRQRALTRTQ